MVADLVASYTLALNEGTTKEQIDGEIQETLELMKGIQRWSSLELQDGKIAFELHLHGQTEREVAAKVAERVQKTLIRFDMATVEYHGVEFPDEVQLAKGKWQGREPIDQIVKEIDGEHYIRLDYYIRGLSFDDLGIADGHTEMLWVKALQTWANKAVGREAIRRVRDHFERLGELRGLKATVTRGRTGRSGGNLESLHVGSRPKAGEEDRRVEEPQREPQREEEPASAA